MGLGVPKRKREMPDGPAPDAGDVQQPVLSSPGGDHHRLRLPQQILFMQMARGMSANLFVSVLQTVDEGPREGPAYDVDMHTNSGEIG